MNPELQKQLADILAAAKTAGTDAYLFLQQQAPDVAQQIVAWKTADAIFGLIICGIFLLIAAILIGVACKIRPKSDSGGFVFLMMIGGSIGLSAVIIGADHGFDLLKAKTAPKIVVMDYISASARGR